MSDGFGAWLAAQMARCGYTSNVDLEHATGIGNTTISRWRNGTMTPSVEQLRKLERPLRTPMLELLVRAGILSTEEAKIPRESLARAAEPVVIADVAEAIKQDTDLLERARDHLLHQYAILREWSDAITANKPTRPVNPAAERPLRAAARRGRPDKP